MHGILTFLTLDTKALHIILRLSLNSNRGNILSNGHQLTIALAGFVNFDCSNVNARNQNTKTFFKAFANVILHSIVDLGRLAFNLNNGDIVR